MGEGLQRARRAALDTRKPKLTEKQLQEILDHARSCYVCSAAGLFGRREAAEKHLKRLPRGPEIYGRLRLTRRLPKGGTGWTSLSSKLLPLDDLLFWLLDMMLPDNAWTSRSPQPGVTVIRINWAKVPDGVRAPKIPGRR